MKQRLCEPNKDKLPLFLFIYITEIPLIGLPSVSDISKASTNSCQSFLQVNIFMPVDSKILKCYYDCVSTKRTKYSTQVS